MLRYELLDVFTDVPFSGNQLAVFLDPPELAADQMQQIAAELNLAETTFAWPTSDPARWSVRIFTPGTELPFAGHPTVGTAAAIVRATSSPGATRLTLAEGVGDVAVEVTYGPDGRLAATLTTATLPEMGDPLDPTVAAAVIGLPLTDLHPELAVQAWSCGVPFTFVPVRDTQALSRAGLDLAAWNETAAGTWGPNPYVVAVDGDGVRARSFVPEAGIIEDAATGAAAAAFAGFLADQVAAGDGRAQWVITQGVEMGRPSRIEVAVDVIAGQATRVQVGGPAVVMGSGELAAP